jgi:hypothetical protein
MMNPSANPNAPILDRLLADLISGADRAGVVIWLEAGTLLGFVRDDDYIPWENDLDFGADAEAVSAEALTSFCDFMASSGYDVRRDESYCHFGLPGSDCHADLNLYRFGGDGLALVELYGPGRSRSARSVDSLIRILDGRPLGIREGSGRARDKWRLRLRVVTKGMPMWLRLRALSVLQRLLGGVMQDVSWRVPSELLKPVDERQFRGVTVFVPAHSEAYLSYRYGSDWRVPRPDWDTWTDDRTIV